MIGRRGPTLRHDWQKDLSLIYYVWRREGGIIYHYVTPPTQTLFANQLKRGGTLWSEVSDWLIDFSAVVKCQGQNTFKVKRQPEDKVTALQNQFIEFVADTQQRLFLSTATVHTAAALRSHETLLFLLFFLTLPRCLSVLSHIQLSALYWQLLYAQRPLHLNLYYISKRNVERHYM